MSAQHPATSQSAAAQGPAPRPAGLLQRWQNSRNALGWAFMFPAAALLIVFLTYPLGLGTWLGFTDAKIGRAGEWIGLENFSFLVTDSVTRLALFNTLFYTVVASVLMISLVPSETGEAELQELLGGAGVVLVQVCEFRQLIMEFCGVLPNCVTLPVHPPRLAHMIPQSGSALQWPALQLCPSSWAVRATRWAKLPVKRDCDRP